MVLKLYYHPGSPPSRAVWLLLAQNHVPFQLVLVDILRGEQHKLEYLQLNPNHSIPTITLSYFKEDDYVLYESNAILRFIVEKFALSDHWYPKEPEARAKINYYLNWHHNNLHLGVAGYTGQLVWTKLGGGQPDESKVTEYHRILEASLKQMDEWLGHTTHLCAADVSIADLNAAEDLTMLEILDYNYNAYPNVQRWRKQMTKLEKWNEVNGIYQDKLLPGFKAALANKR